MPKKNTKAEYFSATLTAADKEHYKHSLVQSAEGMFYLFSDEKSTVAIIQPKLVLPSFDKFLELYPTAESLESLFQTAWNRPSVKGEQKDVVEMATMVWVQLCRTAMNRLSRSGANLTADGKVKRVFKKLENRGYEIIKLDLDPNLKFPPQAKTCLEFLAEMCRVKNPEANPDVLVTIPEKEVMEYVEKEQARLKTRQDPWRIFQYYRPNLIAAGLIRLV